MESTSEIGTNLVCSLSQSAENILSRTNLRPPSIFAASMVHFPQATNEVIGQEPQILFEMERTECSKWRVAKAIVKPLQRGLPSFVIEL